MKLNRELHSDNYKSKCAIMWNSNDTSNGEKIIATVCDK